MCCPVTTLDQPLLRHQTGLSKHWVLSHNVGITFILNQICIVRLSLAKVCSHHKSQQETKIRLLSLKCLNLTFFRDQHEGNSNILYYILQCGDRILITFICTIYIYCIFLLLSNSSSVFFFNQGFSQTGTCCK